MACHRAPRIACISWRSCSCRRCVHVGAFASCLASVQRFKARRRQRSVDRWRARGAHVDLWTAHGASPQSHKAMRTSRSPQAPQALRRRERRPSEIFGNRREEPTCVPCSDHVRADESVLAARAAPTWAPHVVTASDTGIKRGAWAASAGCKKRRNHRLVGPARVHVEELSEQERRPTRPRGPKLTATTRPRLPNLMSGMRTTARRKSTQKSASMSLFI